MKEQFRDKQFRKNIRISYTDNFGNKAIWEKNQSELFDFIEAIVNIYMSKNITLTIRQLYYQLVSRDIIHNSHSAIFDSLMTKVLEGKIVKVIAWYDNEWGYSNRMIDVIKLL